MQVLFEVEAHKGKSEEIPGTNKPVESTLVYLLTFSLTFLKVDFILS